MTKDDANNFIQATFKWLQLRAYHGCDTEVSPTRFRVDAQHSALLERLLEGKDPLPEPPPKSFGYPWYHLIEDGCAEHVEVKLYLPNQGEPALLVNQTLWTILEGGTGPTWVATYEFQVGKDRQTASGRWSFTPMADAGPFGSYRVEKLP